MKSQNLVNIGSGNDLLSDDTKPLPESMLTNKSSVRFCDNYLRTISQEMLHISILDMSLKIICLTHWGRVTHICVSKLSITGSDNGLSPGRRQAIIWTNAGILLIEPWEQNSVKS